MSRMISVISLGGTRTVDLATHYGLQFCRLKQKRPTCNILSRVHRQAYVRTDPELVDSAGSIWVVVPAIHGTAHLQFVYD